jgi:transcriptional regulator with XRE-family HTH domain
MKETFEVVKAYRTARKLSLRKFADEINEKLINTDISHMTVARMEDNERPIEPDMRLLFECIATYTDWRAEWARDCLQSMWHDLFLSGVVRVELPKAE